MNKQLLDPIWCAEFRGFFWGEGYLGICSWGQTPQGHTRLSPRIQISIRDDDADILIDIHRKFGGVLYYNDNKRAKAKANPVCTWRVTKKEDIANILDILDEGVMPSRKREEIAIIREFLETVHAPGIRPSEADYIKREQLHSQIKEFHAYTIE